MTHNDIRQLKINGDGTTYPEVPNLQPVLLASETVLVGFLALEGDFPEIINLFEINKLQRNLLAIIVELDGQKRHDLIYALSDRLFSELSSLIEIETLKLRTNTPDGRKVILTHDEMMLIGNSRGGLFESIPVQNQFKLFVYQLMEKKHPELLSLEADRRFLLPQELEIGLSSEE